MKNLFPVLGIRKILVSAGFAVVFFLGTAGASSSTRRAWSTLADVVKGENQAVYLHGQVADELKRLGVRPGDGVASLGTSFSHHWARLAGVNIVAEVPSEELAAFWELPTSSREQVMRFFAGSGARAVVAKNIPASLLSEGWKPMGDTAYYVHMLTPARRQN